MPGFADAFAVGNAVVEPGGALTSAIWAVALPYALGPTLATLFLRPFTAMPFSLLCSVVVAVMAHNASLVRATPGLEGLLIVEALCSASRECMPRAISASVPT